MAFLNPASPVLNLSTAKDAFITQCASIALNYSTVSMESTMLNLAIWFNGKHVAIIQAAIVTTVA